VCPARKSGIKQLGIRMPMDRPFGIGTVHVAFVTAAQFLAVTTQRCFYCVFR